MGGDGGYIPRRGDLVVRSTKKEITGSADGSKLQNMYWDRNGSFFEASGPGRIRLRPMLEFGEAYCSVSNRRIRKAAFSFPCGCVFDMHVLEFISELCPVCNSRIECFVEI